MAPLDYWNDTDFNFHNPPQYTNEHYLRKRGINETKDLLP